LNPAIKRIGVQNKSTEVVSSTHPRRFVYLNSARELRIDWCMAKRAISECGAHHEGHDLDRPNDLGKGQSIPVMGVYAGFTDTDMGAAIANGPKTPPSQVSRRTVEGTLRGLDHVLADKRAESTKRPRRQDPARLHAEMHTRRDEQQQA
jgi:hypothetical protein